MLQWVITECRKLTQEELDAVTNFKMGPNDTFNCPEYIELTYADKKRRIPVDSVMAGNTKLKDMYFKVLTNIYTGDRILRASTDIGMVWTEQDIQKHKETQEELRQQKLAENPNSIFAGLMLY